MDIATIAALIGEAGALLGVILPMIASMRKISQGMRCQLRSDMLRIYYHNRERRTIRQFEYENFVELYDAYKALKGNSFIDRIYTEVQEWSILS